MPALLLFGALSAATAGETTAPSMVVWFDDFLGIALDPRYVVQTRGTGSVAIASERAINGSVRLSVRGGGQGSSRLLFGCSADPAAADARNWSGRQEVELEARVLTAPASGLEVGVGFVAPSRPVASVAATYGGASGWRLRVEGGGASSSEPATFQYRPGQWVTLRIALTGGAQKSARLFLDGTERARVGGEPVPDDGLCAELRLESRKQDDGIWPEATLWVDYLELKQKR